MITFWKCKKIPFGNLKHVFPITTWTVLRGKISDQFQNDRQGAIAKKYPFDYVE